MPVKVFTANMEYEAIAVRDLLEQNGIPSVTRHNEVPGHGLIMHSLEISGWGDVSVHEGNAERALELIAGFQGSLGELAEMDEDELTELAVSTELSEDELEERDEI